MIVLGLNFKENKRLVSNKYNDGDVNLKEYFYILLGFYFYYFVKKVNLRKIRVG